MVKFTFEQSHSTIKQICRVSKRRARVDNLPIGMKVQRAAFARLFCELDLSEGAEIGVKKGEFSKILCEHNPNLKLYCVDSWGIDDKRYDNRHNRYFETAKKMLAPFNTTMIPKRSMDALADFEDESLDFVYIDANHSFDFCCPDIIFWANKVRPGGIVSGHDYYHHNRGGVVKAVDAYTHCHKIDPWYVTVEKHPSFLWVKS